MNAIRATVKSGRLELDTPPEWPDGTEVLIEPTTDTRDLVGMDESQWRDDPDSLADWNDWIRTIEPLELTPEEAERAAEFEKQMRVHNIEAVTRLMQEWNGE